MSLIWIAPANNCEFRIEPAYGVWGHAFFVCLSVCLSLSLSVYMSVSLCSVITIHNRFAYKYSKHKKVRCFNLHIDKNKNKK